MIVWILFSQSTLSSKGWLLITQSVVWWYCEFVHQIPTFCSYHCCG